MRKDLSPWIAPLFIDKNERGQGLGSILLEHARKMLGQMGCSKNLGGGNCGRIN